MNAMASQITSFAIAFIQAQIKENIKAPVTGEFPAQMANKAENVSAWWRHHINTKLLLRPLATAAEYNWACLLIKHLVTPWQTAIGR